MHNDTMKNKAFNGDGRQIVGPRKSPIVSEIKDTSLDYCGLLFSRSSCVLTITIPEVQRLS